MKTLFLFLSLVLFTSACRADVLDAMQSVCLLPQGTGFAYREDEKKIYILTAAHVIESTEPDKDGKLPPTPTEFNCFFFRNGKSTQAKKAKLLWSDYKNELDVFGVQEIHDLAELSLEKKDFKESELPTIVPLANKDYPLKHGLQIITVGCPRCERPSMVHGHIQLVSERAFFFEPDMVPGRSGSPIFDVKGERVIGLVRLRTPLGGWAVSINEMYRQIESQKPKK